MYMLQSAEMMAFFARILLSVSLKVALTVG